LIDFNYEAQRQQSSEARKKSASHAYAAPGHDPGRH
jgi:hypothetical protein